MNNIGAIAYIVVYLPRLEHLTATRSEQFCRGTKRNNLRWQANLLAKSFHSRIAAKQSQLRESEYRAHPNRPHYGHAIQSLQGAFFVTQTREDHGLLERRKIKCQLFSLFEAAGPRIRVPT